MPDQEKRNAITEFLSREFPESQIDTSYESVHKVWSFRINLPAGSFHLAAVTDDFLHNTQVADLLPRLKTFLLVEHLRDMGTARVIVTKQGLALDF